MHMCRTIHVLSLNCLLESKPVQVKTCKVVDSFTLGAVIGFMGKDNLG